MFTLIDINLIILALIAFTNIFIAFITFLQGTRNRANFFFALGALSAGLWVSIGIIRYFVYAGHGGAIEPYLFTKFSTFFALSIFFFFCFFTFSFLEKRIRLSRTQQIILVGIYILNTFTIFTGDYLIQGEEFIINTIQPIYDWGVAYYYVYIPTVLFFFTAGIIKLIFDYSSKERNGLEKKQITLIFFGTGLAGIIGIIFGLVVASIPELVNLFWIGRLSTLLFTGFIAYAILKHNLFNVRVIVTELLTFSIWIFLLIRAILSTSIEEQIINWILFFVILIAGSLLIRSVLQEIRTREEIQNLAKELTEANKRLKELDQMKNQFLSIASHDLRAPLTAIRNFMAMLRDGTYGKLPPAAEEGTNQVFERATEMSEMVENYLNVSRIEQGRMKYDFAYIDLKDTLNEVMKAFVPVAKEKGLTLIYTPITESIPVHGDEPKLREVIENLTINAINYTLKGSIQVEVTKENGKVKITFTDTGIGMSQKTIANLFGLFNAGENSRKYNPKSTGVGLYITKAHVEAHRGTIRAESDGEGKGSRFVVKLPLKLK